MQHFFLRQTINLGGVSESVPEGFMNFAGTQSSDRLVLTVGRFSAPEIFDTNKYLPLKSGFLNWSFLIALPYDFGGDAWTPTYGAAAEWYVDRFAVRVGAFDLSKTPQGGLGFLGYSLDPTFSQFNLVGEVEERHELWGSQASSSSSPISIEATWPRTPMRSPGARRTACLLCSMQYASIKPSQASSVRLRVRPSKTTL